MADKVFRRVDILQGEWLKCEMKIFELVLDSNSCIYIVLPIEIGACAAVANLPKPPGAFFQNS